MLINLRIENFAIIERLELHFEAGLAVFTGETGAGKSIILDAIAALIGGKADPSLLRSGTERAIVEGEFHIPPALQAQVTSLLAGEDLLDAPDYLTLSREIRREGRSLARVNGRSAALSLVRGLGELLVDIHGQSEHLSLLNVRRHLPLLDRFAGDSATLDQYHTAWQRLQAARRQLGHLHETQSEAERRTDLLSFQLQEIESAALRGDEEEELRGERTRLANAEGLAGLAQQAVAGLDEGSPEAPALSDLAGQISAAMAAMARLDPSCQSFAEQAETILSLISDLSLEVRGYQESIEYNPRRLEQVEERLELIRRLLRKYGGTVAAVQRFAEKAREELDAIHTVGDRIAALEVEEQAALAQALRLAAELTDLRKRAAADLEQGVESELAGLHMPGARFAVRFSEKPEEGEPGQALRLGAEGADQVEFYIAPNPGEGLKPLVKIASGGETSRLMLALKNALVGAVAVPTLIFDEIDQGIGGRVGSVVGEKLWRLGRSHSVLCVTHLPQLAAFANQHFSVGKQVVDGRTSTQVERLDEAGRLEELAAMLGSRSAANRQAARATLDAARSVIALRSETAEH